MSSTISIVTATFNVETFIPALIASLKNQTDSDFEWVVADGGSRDGTLELLTQAADDLNIVIDSRPDFGIYDALNRAIHLSNGEFYLVIGADDTLYPDAIANFRRHVAATNADIIAAKIVCDGKTFGVRRPWPWLYGQFAYVSSHAVGSLIRRSLHERLGFYCASYPIAADQLFLLQAVKSRAQIVSVDSIAGEFYSKGLSGTDILGVLSESFRVQVKVGENPCIQFLLFSLRVIRHWRKITN
jgi:glycosyltransferase involved in cell wall biosynthesis